MDIEAQIRPLLEETNDYISTLEKSLYNEKSQWIDEAQQMMSVISDNLQQMSFLQLDSMDAKKLQKVGFRLWHTALDIRKWKPSEELFSCKVRQLACNFVMTAHVTIRHEKDLADYFAIFKMFVSTAIAWEDCRNWQMAENEFIAAEKFWDSTMSEKLTETKDEDVNKQDYLSKRMELGACRARVNWELKNEDISFESAQAARALLSKTSSQNNLQILVQVGWRWARHLYSEDKHAHVARWLEITISSNGALPNYNKATQGRYYSMLADVHLSKPSPDKALRCIKAAENEHSSAHTDCLRIKYHLKVEEYPEASQSLKTLLGRSNTSISIKLIALNLIAGANEPICMEAAINGYGSILRTVKNEAESVAGNAPVNYPEEYNMIRLEWLEFLMSPYVAANNKSLCIKLTTAICRDHVTHKVVMTPTNLSSVSVLLWKAAEDSFHGGEYAQSRQWYLEILKITPVEDVSNTAKALSLRLEDHQQAEETITKAKAADPSSCQTYFLLALASIKAGKEDQAKEAISDFNLMYLVAIARAAHQTGMENLVVPTLEAIIANADTSVDPGVKGRVLFTLVQMASEEQDIKKKIEMIRGYFQSCINVLALTSVDMVFADNYDDLEAMAEAAWFHGHLAMKEENDIELGVDLLKSAVELFSKLPEPSARSKSVKSLCSITAASHIISMALDLPKDDENKTAKLTKALATLNGVDVDTQDDVEGNKATSQTPVVVATLKFQCFVNLNMGPEATTILKELSNLPGTTPQTLLTCSLMASAVSPKMCIEALESCVMVTQKAGDVSLLASVWREIAMRQRQLGGAVATREVFAVVARELAQDDMRELEWFICTCWNNGVLSFGRDRLAEAEQWLGLAVRLANHSSDKHYEDRLLTQYTNLLAEVKDKMELSATA